LICHPNKPFNESGVYTKVKVEVNWNYDCTAIRRAYRKPMWI
jgi:hypothetical protein